MVTLFNSVHIFHQSFIWVTIQSSQIMIYYSKIFFYHSDKREGVTNVKLVERPPVERHMVISWEQVKGL